MRLNYLDEKVQYITEDKSWSMNAATVPLNKAREHAEKVFSASGKSLDELLPDFDKNYTNLQASTKAALDIPRIQMPVIDPGDDMERFQRDLEKGRLDIVKPWAMGHLSTPTNLKKDKEGFEWLKLGLADGSKTDDYVKARFTRIKAGRLLPTQSQIWFDKIVAIFDKFGVAKQGGNATEMTVIASKEGYILDGHHRYAQCVLADPKLRMMVLYVPIDIKTLLKIGRSYGNAIGNQQKA